MSKSFTLREIASLVKSGQKYSDGDVIEKVLSVPLIVRAVEQRERVLTKIANLRTPDCQVLQVFFPDEGGKYPWQQDCTPPYKKVQLILPLKQAN